MNPEKVTLRKTLKNKLENIDFLNLIHKSDQLQNRFQSEFFATLKSLDQSKYVVGFYPFGSEPQINLEYFSFPIAYVRIDDWDQRQMVASVARRDLPGLWEEFCPKPDIQIYQPTQEQPKILTEQISVILVPGLGFDQNANRLGRGKGFYDQFLLQHPHALRVGIAFQEQIVAQVPTDEWDQPLDVILTDEVTIQTTRFSDWKKCGKVESR